MEEEEEEGSPRPPRTKRAQPDWPSPSEEPGEKALKFVEQMKEDLFGWLPNVLVGDILLNIESIRDIVWLCKVNTRVEEICKSRQFWLALYYGDKKLNVPLADLADAARSSNFDVGELKNLYRWEDTVYFLKSPEYKYLPKSEWWDNPDLVEREGHDFRFMVIRMLPSPYDKTGRKWLPAIKREGVDEDDEGVEEKLKTVIKCEKIKTLDDLPGANDLESWNDAEGAVFICDLVGDDH